MRYALLAALLLAVPARASGMQYVPKWYMRDGAACYGFEDAKKLVELDTRVGELVGEKAACAARTAALEKKAELLPLVEKERDGWKDLANQRLKALEACERGEGTCERPSDATGWYVAGGLALVLAGALVGLLVH